MRTICLSLLLFAACAMPARSSAPSGSPNGSFRCTIEVGHFDVAAVLTAATAPLADGSLIEIYEDTDRDGSPSSADRKLTPVGTTDPNLNQPDLTVNGHSRLDNSGLFLCSVTIELTTSNLLYFRIYNGVASESAMGYWESPFYSLLPGFQQISFDGSEWTWHACRNLPRIDEHADSGSRVLRREFSTPNHLASFPNPFNSRTSIAFELTERAAVRIQVYDIVGRLVGTLADREFESGSHRVEFNAEGLPSGTYLVYLGQAGHSALMTRVLLVR